MKTKLLFIFLLLLTFVSGYSQWTQQQNMPLMVGQGGAVPNPNGKIYYFGGSSQGNELDTLLILNQVGNSWSTGPNCPVAARGFAYALGLDTCFYWFSGYNSTAPDHLDSAYKFNPATNTWTKLAGIIDPVWEATAATAPNGKIYVFGGEDDSLDAGCKRVQIYDPIGDNWTRGSNMPYGVVGARAITANNGLIYLIGGIDSSESNLLDSVYAYDPVQDTWTRKQPLPEPLIEASVVLDENGDIWCMGGKGNEGNQGLPVYDSVWIYNPTSDTWMAGPSLPLPMGEASAVFINNGINIMAASDSTGYTDTNFRISVAPNNIKPIAVKGRFSVYPNPSAGQINISIEKAESESVLIEITNITGQIMYSETWSNLKSGEVKQLDVSNYSKGTYFIKYRTSQSTSVEKIMIQ